MGAYIPWITVIAVVAILVMMVLPMFKKKKACGCTDKLILDQGPLAGNGPAVIDSNLVQATNNVADDISLMS